MILAMRHTSATMLAQNPTRAQAAAQARGEAEGARADAAQARAEAAQARQEAQQVVRDARQRGTSEQSGGVITITKDGRTITLDGASPEAIATALGLPMPDSRQESDGPYVIGGLAVVSTAIVVLAAITMWYRTKMRGAVNPAQLSTDLTQRLARMENGIESVAVEVERISEGQRFTTRLLSDRAPLEVPRG